MARTITVLAAPPTVSAKAAFVAHEAVVQEIDVEKLKAKLAQLTSDVRDIFDTNRAQTGFHLSEVQVGVEISTEGGVSLIGTLKAGATAAITLTFGMK